MSLLPLSAAGLDWQLQLIATIAAATVATIAIEPAVIDTFAASGFASDSLQPFAIAVAIVEMQLTIAIAMSAVVVAIELAMIFGRLRAAAAVCIAVSSLLST